MDHECMIRSHYNHIGCKMSGLLLIFWEHCWTSLLHCLCRYDAVRSQQIFRDGTWKCPVCMDDKLGKNFVRLPICCHIFCTECFSEYCRVNVECGQVDLVCPEHKCSTALEPHILQEALSKVNPESCLQMKACRLDSRVFGNNHRAARVACAQ